MLVDSIREMHRRQQDGSDDKVVTSLTFKKQKVLVDWLQLPRCWLIESN